MSEARMRPIPPFGSEDEEREFWATHDSTEFVDWSKAKRTHFDNLNASSAKRSGQLPIDLFKRLLEAALRPKCRIIQLDVFGDDPESGTRDEPFDDIGKIHLPSRVVMKYRLENISTSILTTGTVKLYFDEDGHISELGSLDLLGGPLEREFAGAIVDSLAAAVEYYAIGRAQHS